MIVPGSTAEEKYERFMKLAGPYRMSSVSGEFHDEILEPDHWHRYHAGTAFSPSDASLA